MMQAGPWLPPAPAEDERALETDVMRFMALFGFCLMAVFALIQAIPVSQQSGGIGLQTQDLVAKQLAALDSQLEALQEQMHEATAALVAQRAALQALERNNADLRERNARLEARQRVLETELDRLHDRWRQQSEDTQAQAIDLARADDNLRELRRTMNRQQDQVARLREDIARLNEELADAQTAQASARPMQSKPTPPVPAALPPLDRPTSVTAAAQKLQPKTQPPQTLPPQTKPPQTSERALPSRAQSAARKPVLTMRFDSTDAIERLIRSGGTVLYGVVGERAWASTPAGAFVRSTKPGRPYQLTETPGRSITQRFRRGSGLVSASTVQWWVTFDSTILQRIGQQIAAHDSGELIIDALGRVRHQPHDTGVRP